MTPKLHRALALLMALTAMFAGLASGPALAAPAAGGPQPLHFDQMGNNEKQDPIEQQTPWVRAPYCTLQCAFPDDHSQWVTNPTSCWWDTDDHRSLYATGDYLDAGASVQVTDCQIAETGIQYQ